VLGEPITESVTPLVAARAQLQPDALAVDGGDTTLTYGELWSWALTHAHALRAQGVATGDRVAIVGRRSVEFVVALVGTMHAGAVAVPIDSDLPLTRQRVMVRESEARLVVSLHGDTALGDDLAVIGMDRAGTAPGESGTWDPPKPEDAAYVFFTSGSTGTPKGALGTHSALAQFTSWHRDVLDIDTTDRVSVLRSLSFDAILREVFTPLVTGATIAVAPPNLAPDDVLAWLRSAEVSILHVTPSHSAVWLSDTAPKTGFKLRATIFSGELLTSNHVRQWRSHLDRPGEIINMYGPTETTMAITVHRVEDAPEEGPISVGMPRSHAQALVVDEHDRLCPPRVRGEVLLRTPYRTRGYINDPIAQQQAFVPNPFNDDPADIVYRTGDLGWMDEDGRLMITGRIDDQVQILGLRVEPAEVAAHLTAYPGLKAAEVLAFGEPGEVPTLTAYVAADPAITEGDLRVHLMERLDRPKIPSTFVFLDELPVNDRGKVDRNALRSIQPTRPADTLRARVESLDADKRAELARALREKAARKPNEDVHRRAATLSSEDRRLLVDRLRSRAEERSTTDRISELSDAKRKLLERRLAQRTAAGSHPLSFAQERLWFLDKLEPGAKNYLVQRIFRLSGPLDIAALSSALDEIGKRHEILRTRYVEDDGVPAQVIDPPEPASFEIRDLRGPGAPASDELEEALDAALSRGFDLETGPVWRSTLFRTGRDEHVLLISIHHIASDGWSFPTLMAELSELYRASLEDRPADLPALPIQYRDYASWQRRRFEEGELDGELEYWQGQLGDDPPHLDIPTSKRRPARPTTRAGLVSITLDDVKTAELAEFAASAAMTPTMVSLASIGAALNRFAGTADIVIGVPSADRAWGKTSPLIGFFVNTLPIRMRMSGDMSFSDLLAQVKQTSLDAYANREVPFERVVQAVEPTRDPGRNPIFQLMFQFNQKAFRRPLDLPDVEEEQILRPATSSKVDVSLSIRDDDDGDLRLVATYKSDVFSADDMTMLLRYLAETIRAGLRAPDVPLERLPLPDPAAQREMPIDWGPHTDVVDTFRRSVQRAPDSPAIIDGSRQITYEELDLRASAVAEALRAHDIGAGDRVALLLGRGTDLVAAMLGTLYVGAAFVPLDVENLSERTHAVIADSQPAAIITNDDRVPSEEWPNIRRIEPGASARGPIAPEQVDPDTSAYVIYTSGSTGTPKGVDVPRRALAAFSQAALNAYGTTSRDRVLQFHSPSFDASLEEIFPTLAAGATIVSPPADLMGTIRHFVRMIHETGLTTLSIPTALWHELVEDLRESNVDLPGGLRSVIIGGEAADARLVRAWRDRFGDSVRLLNSYGPTETTVAVTVADLSKIADPGDDRVTIGTPFPTVATHIVDDRLHAVAPGVVGELCIEGPQVASGYLGRPELTNDVFVLAPQSGSIWYRTGDRVLLRPDGLLEYVGRTDSQVKVRGHRVELTEIEAALNEHDRIGASVVTYEHEVLSAHVETDLTRAAVQEHLTERLPSYMLPTHLEVVDRLPRLPSGKLDRSALDSNRPAPRVESKPPDPTSQKMVAIWSDVLQAKVEPDDDFFDIGGHSLLAVRLLSRIERELGVSLPMVSIFEAPTPRGLAALAAVEQSDIGGDPAILIKKGTTPPLFCVHAGGGHVFAYQPLADQLPPEQTVYGISAPGVDGFGEPSQTMAGLVEHSLASILRVQPSGPYRLLGWSIGGLIAYETARRLTDMGHRVDFVGLLDTVAPGQHRQLSEVLASTLQTEGLKGIPKVASVQRRRLRSTAARLYHEAHSKALKLRGRQTPPILAGKRVYHASVLAMKSHESGPYSGRVVYFRAVDAMTQAGPRDNPWRELVPHVEVVDVPGDHGTLVQAPQVIHLGAELRRILHELDAT
jgi:amino acid adenylation domain-containing protein